ncbi:Disease resistance protein RGA2 [Rhynchospora pubera]|uniref:Disease resistance protein RGA2 n=1 Tax=Rhynchospora pubera TaxID=906938 RepID=A0AAV8EKW6_9POAL|nr:Disease resistance protein RGA2 [Rhynchospora pubera]
MASWVSTAVSAIAGHADAGSAVNSIVSCTASAVVEKIVDMGFSFISKPTVPMESETALKRVQNALPQIRAIMSVAEALKMKDPSCSEWFEQSWLAVHAAEDVLDELEYNKLVDMVKSRYEGSGSASSSKKYKTCAMSDDILGRLKKVVRMLDEAAAGVDRLLQLADKLGIRYLSESQIELGADLRRETTSFLVEREVFGRDVEKGLIIDWLSRPTQVQLSSLGIIGVGGLGKTTLAQFAYQEMHVKDYFEKTIWVCVSTNFSVESITTKILAELGGNSCGDYPLNVLQESLKGKIHSKKFLLILDDVWEDKKRRDWEQLIAPLRFAQQGSKILFTTRMKSVANLLADVINTEHCSLTLQDLAEQELRSLFNSYAFHGFNPNNHGDLLAIGDQIIKLLRGSPLAAKVIGSLLNSRMDLLYWRRILSHGSLINSEQGKDIINVLKLSYYNLPTDLKVCFRFCSIFPRDYLFNKKELIEMWMTSGFIRQHSCQEERLEDIGEDFFNHLLRKSIFEPWGKKQYVMHDLIHEMAEIVSNGECFRVIPNDKSIAI